MSINIQMLIFDKSNISLVKQLFKQSHTTFCTYDLNKIQKFGCD